jgi:putative DNA primase/helicase
MHDEALRRLLNEVKQSGDPRAPHRKDFIQLLALVDTKTLSVVKAELLSAFRGKLETKKWEREMHQARAELNTKYGRERRRSAHSKAKDAMNPKTPPDLLRFLHNDHGNSGRLVALYGEDIRYCHAMKKWFVWDGMRWALDDTDQVRRLAKQAMLEFLRQVIDSNAGEQADKFARSSLDSKRISSTLSMAESEIYVRPAELDINPDLLTFLNGTVDLRTGELRAHDRHDLITKLVHHRYRPGAPCGRWLRFLDEAMGGGADATEGALERAQRMVAYLQRALGYSLTGCTIEKCVFVPFGPPDAGKSTMLTTFRQLIEEHTVLLQVDSLMVRQESNNTQADLADLRGARFVQTSETEEGQRLAQGKLKRITQGMGKIKAVRKYENPIEFAETHKLWLDTNRKPTIRDAEDKATFNRLHPIPFTISVPKQRQDRELLAKLTAEAEGILAWAVEGAGLWYRDGLQRPQEIEAARDGWQAEADHIGRFLEEMCVVGNGLRCPAMVLYRQYKRWVEDSGEHAITLTAFGLKIADRGFSKDTTKSGVHYNDIGLKAGSSGEGEH